MKDVWGQHTWKLSESMMVEPATDAGTLRTCLVHSFMITRSLCSLYTV